MVFSTIAGLVAPPAGGRGTRAALTLSGFIPQWGIRRLMLQFRGSVITSEAGLLPFFASWMTALSRTDTGADVLCDTRSIRSGPPH
jgi:hypothetical protein